MPHLPTNTIPSPTGLISTHGGGSQPIDKEHPYGATFFRHNPYESIGNAEGKMLRQLIIDLGKKLEANEVTDGELVQFFQHHKLVFDNPRTGMPSADFRESEFSPDKVRLIAYGISCSCLCGPIEEPCNQLGPGSKPAYDWSFKKEEAK